MPLKRAVDENPRRRCDHPRRHNRFREGGTGERPAGRRTGGPYLPRSRSSARLEESIDDAIRSAVARGRCGGGGRRSRKHPASTLV